MSTYIIVFAWIGALMTGLVGICLFCCFVDWLKEWHHRLENHKHASELEAEIADLKAKLAIVTEGAPASSRGAACRR